MSRLPRHETSPSWLTWQPTQPWSSAISAGVPDPNRVFIGCAICLGSLSRPVELACGHTYCWVCLMNAPKAHSCPLCKKVHIMDPKELRERRDNYRNGYRAWRQGRAHGSRGEVAGIKNPELGDTRNRPTEKVQTLGRAGASVAGLNVLHNLAGVPTDAAAGPVEPLPFKSIADILAGSQPLPLESVAHLSPTQAAALGRTPMLPGAAAEHTNANIQAVVEAEHIPGWNAGPATWHGPTDGSTSLAAAAAAAAVSAPPSSDGLSNTEGQQSLLPPLVAVAVAAAPGSRAPLPSPTEAIPLPVPIESGGVGGVGGVGSGGGGGDDDSGVVGTGVDVGVGDSGSCGGKVESSGDGDRKRRQPIVLSVPGGESGVAYAGQPYVTPVSVAAAAYAEEGSIVELLPPPPAQRRRLMPGPQQVPNHYTASPPPFIAHAPNPKLHCMAVSLACVRWHFRLTHPSWPQLPPPPPPPPPPQQPAEPAHFLSIAGATAVGSIPGLRAPCHATAAVMPGGGEEHEDERMVVAEVHQPMERRRRRRANTGLSKRRATGAIQLLVRSPAFCPFVRPPLQQRYVVPTRALPSPHPSSSHGPPASERLSMLACHQLAVSKLPAIASAVCRSRDGHVVAVRCRCRPRRE